MPIRLDTCRCQALHDLNHAMNEHEYLAVVVEFVMSFSCQGCLLVLASIPRYEGELYVHFRRFLVYPSHSIFYQRSTLYQILKKITNTFYYFFRQSTAAY